MNYCDDVGFGALQVTGGLGLQGIEAAGDGHPSSTPGLPSILDWKMDGSMYCTAFSIMALNPWYFKEASAVSACIMTCSLAVHEKS